MRESGLVTITPTVLTLLEATFVSAEQILLEMVEHADVSYFVVSFPIFEFFAFRVFSCEGFTHREQILGNVRYLKVIQISSMINR